MMGSAVPENKTDTPVSKDTLLEALVFLTSHFGHTRSASSLAAGLPVDKKGLTPSLFCKAAERAGLKAKVVQRALGQIPEEVFPVVLITKDNKALVALEREEKGELKVFDPSSGEEKKFSAKELGKNYAGYAIYTKLDLMREMDNHWFWSVVRESTDIYGQVLVASVLINLFALVSPLYIMNFYDRVLPNNAVETGWVLSLGAASVFVFDFFIRTLRGYFIDIAGRRSDVLLAQKLFDQVLDMRLEAKSSSTGAFANNLKEFDALREFFTSATMAWFVDFPFSLLFIGIIWMLAGSTMALLLVFLYIVVAVVGYVMQIPVKKKVHQAMKTGEQKHSLLVETLGNIETIKGVGGEGALRASYSEYVARSAEAGQKSRFYSGMSVNFSAFIQQLSNIALVLLGMYLIADKELTMGALIACVILGSRAIAPIGQIASLINKYHQARSSYRSLDSVMRQPVERPHDKKFLHRPVLKGDFALKGVSFAYPRAGYKVLDNVSLNIKPGNKVAVAGRIGSGKSTLVKLLLNFYDPIDGTIMLDETDIRQIDPADIRRNIAYMGQDTALMSGTVRENITMGNVAATDEDVLRVAEITGVHEFVRRHPQGYDAPVGERGEGFSGGQRQSIALARTLLMDTPIVVLDEPTNMMDAATEERVMANLEVYLKDKTLVLVTHKPSLLKLVNRLVIMDAGKIMVDGPKDQVMKALAEGQIKVSKA